MLKLVSRLDRRVFTPRVYFLAETDHFSLARLEQFEAGRSDYTVYRIPRAREVKQSYLTSVFSFAKAFVACLQPTNTHQVLKITLNLL